MSDKLDEIGDKVIGEYLSRLDEFTKEDLLEAVVLEMKWEAKKLLK